MEKIDNGKLKSLDTMGGSFQIRDGESIITVDKASEKKMLDFLCLYSPSLRPTRNDRYSQNNQFICAGNPLLIDSNDFTTLKDVDSVLDSCVKSYLGD